MSASVSADILKQYISRLERLEQEKSDLQTDIREVYAEAKSNGYDPKIMRQVIRLRKIEDSKRAAIQYELDTYLSALGMHVESE